MKKGYFLLLFTYCLLLTVFLGGCGSGPGSPGSSGSEDTGIRIKTVDISKAEGPDIDIFSNQNLVCPPDKPTKGEALLHREDATMTIEAEKLNPTSTFDPFPASIEQCTITYLRAVEDPSSPLIPSLTIFPNCSVNDGSNVCIVTLIDLQRKEDFFNAVSSGVNVPAEIPTHYVAKYNCVYKNNINESGTLQGEFDIWLADFLICD